MRLVIVAVGRLKEGPERQLFERYRERFDVTARPLGWGPVKAIEVIESRAGDVAGRQSDEADRILAKTGNSDSRVVLDGGGRQFTSEAFARFVQSERDRGVRSLAFLIGGPDGHGERLLQACNLTLSLGSMTLPHMLARIILAEQLYRAATIMTGHPYHRSG